MTSVSSIKIGREVALAHFERNVAIDQVFSGVSQSGVFFVLAPKSSDAKAIERLDVGGILPAGDLMRSGALSVRSVRNTVLNLARLIQCILHSESATEWYFREPYAGAAPIGSNLQQIGDKHYARMKLPPDADLLKIAQVIEDHRESWSFFMFCRSEKQSKSLERADVQFMAVNAYDGESFCCWVDERSAFARELLGYEGKL